MEAIATPNLILIVEDNPYNLQVLSAIVVDCGFKPGIAMNAKQAYKFLEKHIPDLILLDVMMPDIDGYEVCRTIKSNDVFKDIPIIFITAKTEKNDIVTGFEAGGVDYIAKPFNSTELKMRICTHMELKQSRDKLVLLNKELQTLNATKDKLFSIIAHDIRSPFNSILGFTDLLSSNLKSYSLDKIAEIVNVLNTSTKKTYNLLDNLLDWAKTQTKQIKFNPELLDISLIIRNIINDLDFFASTKKISFKYNPIENVKVNADQNMLSSIIRNLISNAVKFSNTNGYITITLLQNAEYVEVSVADNGVGMTAETSANLFQQNVNESKYGTANEKGSGLGLAICKDFIERHNGTISVESELDKGSTFKFTLPILM